MIKRITLLFIFFFYFFYSNAQNVGGLTSISSSVPANLTICSNAKVFSFTINNPSPFTLTNVTVNLTMPAGVVYHVSTVTNATEVSVTPLNAPTFSLANIPTLTSVVVTFTASVNCDVLAFLSTGNPIENKIKVNYTANSNLFFDNHTTGNYLIKQPNLSITTVTNQSYAGAIGGTFTRCITIINGGLGELSALTLKDIHGNGIQIASVSAGSLTSTPGTETILLGAANFSTIGNNNNLFEQGESITICETVNILNCSSVQSSLEASWGCGSQFCQTTISNANVIFPNFVPNLVLNSITSTATCLTPGNISTQQLRVRNTGVGQAINVNLNIFQATSTGYNAGLQSAIDINSIKISVNGAPAVSYTTMPSVTVASQANSAMACLPANPQGAFTITIPSINPGDVLIVSWDVTSCCQASTINGWRYKGDYQSICLNNYQVVEAWGKVYHNLSTTLSNNGSPSSLVSGTTATFSYMIQQQAFSYPRTPTSHWKVDFTLPNCVTYDPNTIRIVTVNNQIIPTFSTSLTGNVLTALFNFGSGFTTNASLFNQSQILIDLTANCNSCAGGPGAVGVKLSYVNEAGCGCEILEDNKNFSLDIVCPLTCLGLTFKDFSIMRTSYGLPDNDNNGVADASGFLNFGLIRRNRAMFGDTLTASYHATIKTDATHPTWRYCYAKNIMTNGNRVTPVGSQLEIYRNNSLLATCTLTAVTSVGTTTRTFTYDMGSTALIASGGVTTGFVFQNNDSLVFRPRYKVTSNIGNAPILGADCNTEFYVSDIASPTNAVNKFWCNVFKGNFNIIGYYYTNSGGDGYTVNNCNTINISQNYYLSIGPCCNNYASGNLFPFEYRQWATIDTLEAIVPVGYRFVSANFQEFRTSGTLTSPVPSGVFTLTPVSTTSNVFKFPVRQFFTGSTPLIMPSDDGFYGTLNVLLQPSCQVLQNIQEPITYNWKFSPGVFLNPAPSANISTTVGQDVILYNGPDIFVQSPLPNIIANTNMVTWDISLSNTSNSIASNTWFSAPVISGVNIIQVVDLATSATLTPVGGIYQVGSLTASSTKNYRLSATYTSCNLDSIIIQAGWNCQGYPTTLASYPCIPKKIKLQLTPQSPLLITNVVSPPANINLCDTAFYTVEGVNIQLGSAYTLTLTVNLPVGVNIIPGSSQLSYPSGSPYVSISNPIPIGGTLYQYNISVLSPSIAANGLPGILSPTLNAVKIKFKVVTSCGYTSGSLASFSFQGKSACGAPTGQLVSLSSQLGINGATAPYNTDVTLKSTYISPCNNASILNVRVKNLGGLSFGNTDSVSVILPQGVSFVTGSFVGLNNSPVNGVPTIFNNNNQQTLSWKLPPGVVMGDSVKFNISYKGNPKNLSCNIFNFISKTTSSTNLYCSISGNNCGVKVYTGGDTLPVFTYKGYLALTNQTGYSVPNPPSGETGYINFTINNTGEAINAVNKTTISYYRDVNNNGVYNVGDVLVGKDSINTFIPNNGSYNYSYTLSIPSGSACNLIAVVDTALNPCACNPAQILVNLPLRHFAKDTVICSGQTANIGVGAINGYGYTWTPVTNLSSGTIANPLVTGINTTGNPETTNYIVTANRNTCTSKDTATVIVNLTPTANAGPDQNLCATYSTSLAATVPLGILKGNWTVASGPAGSAITTPTLATTTITGLTEGTYKLLWTVNNGSCNPARDTVVLKVYNAPVANAGPDQNQCGVSSITLGAIISAGTSTGAWTRFSGPNVPAITSPTLSSSGVTGLVEGTYKFVWTVSNGNCTPVADTVAINIYNTPVSNAGPDQNLCATYTVALAGNTPAGTSTGNWTRFSGPNVPVITSSTLAGSTVTGLAEGTYKFVWTVNNGNCTPATDTVLVKVYNTPVANAGPDQSLCNTYSVTLAGNIPAGTSTGNWTRFSGPSASAITTPTLAGSTATGLAEGTYKFVWTVSNGNCTAVADTVLIKVYNTPVSNAGPDQNLCNTFATSLSGNIPVGTSTGNWTQASGPNASAITTSTLASSGITGLAEGTYKLVWTVSNGNCTPVTDTVLVNVYNTPVANAGPDQSLCATYSVALAGNIPAGTSTSNWTQASGPNASAITTSTLAGSIATGLTEGTYKFVWTVSNGNCTPVNDTVLIKVYNTPVSNAGPDQSLCNTFVTSLAGNIPAGTSTGNWTQASGPNASAITTPTLASSGITGLAEGTYKYVWTVSNGNCTPVTDTVLVKVYNTPVSNAGPDQSLCNTYTVALAGNVPAGTSTGNWTQFSGPNASAITTATLATSSVTGLAEGTYKFLWTVSNGNCTPAKDTVIIKVYNTPVSNAGPDQSLCNTFMTSLAGNIPAGTSTGVWTRFSGPNASTITSPTLATSAITGLAEGTYKYVWTVSNGNCTAVADTVLVKVYNTPVSNAGPDQSLCATYTVALAGNVPAGTSTGNWTQFSGPNASAITTATLATSTITGLVEGTYKYVWTVSNGNCTAVADTVLVKVYNTPVSNAGPDQSLCTTYSVALAGNVPAGTSTGNWTQLSGPNTSTITSSASPASSVTGLTEGTYRFIWTVSNGSCAPVKDTVSIRVYNTPVSTAGPDQSLCNTYFVTLAGNTPAGTATGNWTQAAGPGIGTIITSTLATSQVIALVEGTYKFVWTVSNGNCTPVTDTVLIKVYNTPVSNAGPDQSLCNTYTVALAGNTPAGTSTGNWTQFSGPNASAITTATLATSTITGLAEGTYKFLWTVSNGSCTPAKDTVIIKVYDTPVANAGANQILCDKTLTTLNGNAPVGTSTGLWTALGGGAIVAPSAYNTTVNGLVTANNYQFVWTVSNGSCPPAKDTVLIQNYGLPVVGLLADMNEICAGSCVNFTDLSKPYLTDAIVSWSWNFNNGSFSNLQNTIGCYGTPGVYPAVLTVTSQVGCVNSATLPGGITVHPKVIADFTIDTDNIDLTTIVQFNDHSTNASLWTWSFGDGGIENGVQNPTHLYTDTGSYVITLIANNQYNCSDATTLTVKVKDVAGMYIPNSFTPNDDGLNDVFYAVVHDYETFEMRIFDRWGQQLFMSNDPMIGWDGTFKGAKVKMDVYVYKVAVKFKSGKDNFLTKNFLGSVTVVK